TARRLRLEPHGCSRWRTSALDGGTHWCAPGATSCPASPGRVDLAGWPPRGLSARSSVGNRDAELPGRAESADPAAQSADRFRAEAAVDRQPGSAAGLAWQHGVL